MEEKEKTEYITVKQAYELKNVSKSAIYQAIAAGTLKRYKAPITGQILLKRSEVENYRPIAFGDRKAQGQKGTPRKNWKPKSRFTTEQWLAAWQRYLDSGCGMKTIATEMGCSVGKVSESFRDLGFNKADRRRKKTAVSDTTSVGGSEVDLWPETAKLLQFEPAELPVDILRAQAAFLAPRTEYCLKGIVRSSNLQDEEVYHSLYVYAPYVREEPFTLFYLKHGIDPWKDIKLVWGDTGSLAGQEFGSAQGPDELRARIKEILSTEVLLRIIGNLIAMSKKAKSDAVSSLGTDEEPDSDAIPIG